MEGLILYLGGEPWSKWRKQQNPALLLCEVFFAQSFNILYIFFSMNIKG